MSLRKECDIPLYFNNKSLTNLQPKAPSGSHCTRRNAKRLGQAHRAGALSFASLWKGDPQLLFFQSSGYVASLPAPVRRRIKALKKLQMDATNIEAKFYEEVVKSSRLTQEMITNAEISDPCLGVQVPRAVHPPV